MKNTTERIIELGGDWRGDSLFIRALWENNPPSAKHWYACITNNPGGNAPCLNPLGW